MIGSNASSELLITLLSQSSSKSANGYLGFRTHPTTHWEYQRCEETMHAWPFISITIYSLLRIDGTIMECIWINSLMCGNRTFVCQKCILAICPKASSTYVSTPVHHQHRYWLNIIIINISVDWTVLEMKSQQSSGRSMGFNFTILMYLFHTFCQGG